MQYERIFLDASFVIALLNKKDKHHHQANKLINFLFKAREVWTTELVLSEIGNALSRGNKKGGVTHFIENCFITENIKIVYTDKSLFKKALDIYNKYKDKDWGITDCVAFILMKEKEITTAFTADNYFIQAGFKIVLA
ncbi:MAG: type II toxin-antitoxin system VapC family toxin [Spirochaetales bacterium]|nr:type II toxin-antitoxin system VapC family toxin [Spirochaetales bacterium]